MPDASAAPPSLLERARGPLRWLADPVELARWVEPHRTRPGARAFLARQLEIFVHTARSVRTEEIGRRAAGLTYYTLLSLVPLLAVGFALFEAFGGLSSLREPLKELVVDWLAAGRSSEVGAWLDQFVSNVKSGAIAGFGVLILFYSAVGLLTNVESAFNRIWGVERLRPLHVRFVIYWCVLTLAPPLVGLSISISAQLQSSSFALAVLTWLPWGLGRLVVTAGSLVAVSLAFIFMYQVVPNTKVELRCAALGGLIASLLWSASKALFIVVTAGSVKYSAVYGALSTLPLLMIWLYLSWTIVLFGVTYTSTYQTMVSVRLEARAEPSPAARERVAASLLVEIAHRFARGEPAADERALASAVGVPAGSAGAALEALARAGLVLEVSPRGAGASVTYAPASDLDRATLAELVEALRHQGAAAPALAASPRRHRLDELLARAAAAEASILRSVNLRELVAEAPARADGEAPESGSDVSRVAP
ncbi:MAG: YhjD/YihY/BrkB family envelope integrity protein [Kofleriaceae bacterium]